MAEAQEPVSAVAEEEDKKSRRRLFGRRKEEPTEIRSETEWVDTLRAAEGDEEPPLAGSPFATEDVDDEPSGLPEAPAFTGTPTYRATGGDEHLPEEAAEVGDEVVIRERSLYRPEKLALENRVRSAHQHRGESDAFYEKSWTRRTGESMEDIHNYIDNVIGTEIDPSRRRERRARAGYRPTTGDEGTASVHVEGLEQDIMLAFSFPREEFRGARVVYETEGGYVVEVTRAVGNDDDRRETQYYTVSRVGEVGHVLDKMRAREAERLARERGVAPVAPIAEPEPDDASTEPIVEPPEPADVGAPGAAHDTKAPEEPADEPAAGGHGAAPQLTADDTRANKFGALFKRKDEDADADNPAPAHADEGSGTADNLAGKFGKMFKRDKDDDEAADDEDGGKKRGLTGLLKRGKGDESSDP